MHRYVNAHTCLGILYDLISSIPQTADTNIWLINGSMPYKTFQRIGYSLRGSLAWMLLRIVKQMFRRNLNG